MEINEARSQEEWDAFLTAERFSPFLQSWTMGEVYRDLGQEPVRLEVRENGRIVGICFGHIVPARRGRHLSIPYGPILARGDVFPMLLKELKRVAMAHGCAFVRMSPFWPAEQTTANTQGRPSPLHLLAEHIWYLPLTNPNPWTNPDSASGMPRTESELLAGMRATARNLIRRAEKEGVTVTASLDPLTDLSHFLHLHEETRVRHGFTPYFTSFFRAQLERFAKRGEATLYLAHYKGEVIASSIHMHLGGETSYHHGASTRKYPVPASYLLQWTAIRDALRRGDKIYNFWGISPEGVTKHPFAGVRTFKTAFGGELLELTHCKDFPLSSRYYLTHTVETIRKWRRGF